MMAPWHVRRPKIISVHFEKIHLSDRTDVLRDFMSWLGSVFLSQRILLICRTVVAALLKPLHWVACGLAMCLAVVLAGTLILIEQKVARSRHSGRHTAA